MPRRSKVEELKDLSGSTTVDRLGDLEIFRSAQDDNFFAATVVLAGPVNPSKDGVGRPLVVRLGTCTFFADTMRAPTGFTVKASIKSEGDICFRPKNKVLQIDNCSTFI